MSGGDASATPLRVLVTDPVGIHHPGGFADAGRLPGRQGRTVFALLVTERRRPLTRDVVADRLWGDRPPSAWEAALSALLSKIRRLLDEVDPTGTATVETAFGAHQLHLPPDTRVDIEVARASLDRAEAAWRDGHLDLAWADAHVTWSIASRTFLAGEEAPWVDRVRRELHDLTVRALSCLADVWHERGEFELAARCAADIIAREPFREDAHRRLMRAQAGAGNRAQALRTFDELARLLDDELGVAPAAETVDLRGRIVRD